MNNFVQVPIYHQLRNCHSAQQLVASSLSFYLSMYMYVSALSKPQVTKAPQVAQFIIYTRHPLLKLTLKSQ